MRPSRKYIIRTMLGLCYLFLVEQQSFAQLPKLEFGVTGGLSGFLGDLGGGAGRGSKFLKDAQWSLTKNLQGVYAAYRPFELINIQVAFNRGSVSAADSLITATDAFAQARKNRNQHFTSRIHELYVALEIFPSVLIEYNPNEVYRHIHPYFLIGFGFFSFNPKAEYISSDGTRRMVELQPLRTEGQGMPNFPERKPYSLMSKHIPHGVGIKYFYNRQLAIALEMVLRKTFTDYIDDVSTNYVANEDFENFFGKGSETSNIAIQMANKAAYANGGKYVLGYGPGAQRGHPNENDTYFSLNLKLSYRIGDVWYDKKGGDIKCPKF